MGGLEVGEGVLNWRSDGPPGPSPSPSLPLGPVSLTPGWQWLWWRERRVREGQAGQSADARGPASLAALQGVGPRRCPVLTGVPHLYQEVRGTPRELCDSSLFSRLKVGGSAPPNTEQGARGGVRHRQDRAPTLWQEPQLGRVWGLGLKPSLVDTQCLYCQGYFFGGAECWQWPSGDLRSPWVNMPGLKHGLPSLNSYKGHPPALSSRLVNSFSGASEGGCVAT